MSKILDYFDIQLDESTEKKIEVEERLEWQSLENDGFGGITTESSKENIFKAAYYLGFRSALFDVLGCEIDAKP